MTADRYPGEELAWLLSRVAHQLDQRLCAILEMEGLTLAQWRVLRRLSDGTGHAMTEVAHDAMLPPPTLTKAVDQLVSANLVQRRADLRDRRRVLIHLTARGRRLQQQLVGKLSPATGIFREVLDEADLALLTQLLQRILRAHQ
jgi:MarR family transcriptional regulator, organic hydroperoxide resistance regulator